MREAMVLGSFLQLYELLTPLPGKMIHILDEHEKVNSGYLSKPHGIILY